jgi:N-acetyl-anhydromuramyl-L-alanine amidase AmpD
MAKYAKDDNKNKLPASIKDWYGVVARVSGYVDQVKAQEFADSVYSTIKTGASLETTDGQALNLKAQADIQANKETLKLPETVQLFKGNGSSQPKPECPRSLVCKFVPAHYAQNDPANSADYGNVDPANRPEDMKIKYIVIHDTEGSYQSAIDWFQDPASYVSAHYVIRSSDGEVTQMVKNKDVAWHAGNWYMNMHSIGIEHEGYAAEGGAWYTEAMYRSSAKLVRYLADKYDIPLDREHVVGHEQYHGLTPARAKLMHNDPGPFWDWEHYMGLLRAEPIRSDGRHSNAVTIAPQFEKNKPEVSQCIATVCTALPAQSANFVRLYTQPNSNAPLLTDAGLHPDGAQGTTDIDDWSAVAAYGQRYAVADKQGDWTAIWFGGQKGWFYNPDSWKKRTAVPNDARLVTPKAGKTMVPVYGRPVPETSAYTNGVPPLTPVPLQYNLLAGQSYVAYDKKAINDYYHVLTFDSSTAGEGEVVIGNEKYIPISYNHRQAFVKASDVDLSRSY